jgi:hypothetical protein
MASCMVFFMRLENMILGVFGGDPLFLTAISIRAIPFKIVRYKRIEIATKVKHLHRNS